LRDAIGVAVDPDGRERQRIIIFVEGAWPAALKFDRAADGDAGNSLKPACFLIREIDEAAIGDTDFIQALGNSRSKEGSRHRRGDNELLVMKIIERWSAERASRHPNLALFRIDDDRAIFADDAAICAIAPSFHRVPVESRGSASVFAQVGSDLGGIVEITMKDDNAAAGQDRGAPRPALCGSGAQWPICKMQTADFSGPRVAAYSGTKGRSEPCRDIGKIVACGIKPGPGECQHAS
jgi:hypothetical protein